MRSRSRIVALLTLAGATAVGTAVVHASSSDRMTFSNVATANEKAPGYAPPNKLSVELAEIVSAQGSTKLENPADGVDYYGYDTNGRPMVPPVGSNVEAQKTEPDKNTYLVFEQGLKGADPAYDYGTHFLFQGHEAGSPGSVTRINLDADAAHRVTLIATQTSAAAPLKTIDGSTWDPFAQRLLFTNEGGANGAVYQTTPVPGGPVDDISGQLGRAGFEGIQNDDRGNLYYVEDTGGAVGTGANARARRPNSFVYRFQPENAADLRQGGRIQALQVLVAGAPLVFGPSADADINAPGYLALHQYGTSYPTKWIDLVTTDSTTSLPGPDLNALAKAKGATPFKRPENGNFRPGTRFAEFYFDETGDTDNRTSAAASGGFGALFKLVQSPSSDDGRISILYNGDQVHAGFDNLAFFSKDQLAAVEDAGDTLHTQRNALDSAWLFDVTADYSNPANQPIRFIAEARDPSATIDSGLSGSSGFTNDGDNEITGIHVSDGDPSVQGILGAKTPQPFRPDGHWRAFWTQQHGDNITWELIVR
ncbi:MAG TPA: alkaline phosphatase PhoX [Gaiellaceae bacterium]